MGTKWTGRTNRDICQYQNLRAKILTQVVYRKRLEPISDGHSLSGVRTQFLKRLVEFADRHQLTIHLAYYPPYHSKYNAVERGWGILENHWNGALLTDAKTAIEWAKTMTWKGISPIVKVLEGVYQTGVKVAKKAFRMLQKHLRRHDDLGKWDVVIEPCNSSDQVLCENG